MGFSLSIRDSVINKMYYHLTIARFVGFPETRIVGCVSLDPLYSSSGGALSRPTKSLGVVVSKG
jgi:hypothetical protein